MRRFVLAGAAFASVVLLAACEQEGNAGGEGTTSQARNTRGEETQEGAPHTNTPRPPPFRDPYPSDGSIICPGSSNCPDVEVGVAPQPQRKIKPIGVLIHKDDRGDDILCPQDGPGKCPPGYHGRLWKAPTQAPLQSVCPGGQGCPTNQDWFGWVCPWDGTNAPAKCVGRPKKD